MLPKTPFRRSACAVLAGVVCLVPAASATEVLTLDRAIELATDAHPDLAAADARVDAAGARVRAAEAGRGPRVVGEASVQETNNPTLVFSNLLGQAAFTEANFAVDALTTPDALSNWRGQVRVEQPLWTAGRLGAGIAAAGVDRDATAAERDQTRQQVVRGVVDAWTGAVLAHRAVAVHATTVETARKHVDLVRDLHQGGLAIEADRLRAEVRLAEAEGDLAGAEADATIADAALARALGQPPGTAYTVPETLARPIAPDDATLDALVAEARERRPELRAMALRREAAERLAELARAERRPSVGLGAFAEANAEDFFGADGDNWGVTIALDVPLYDPARRARADEADARVDEADARARSLDQGITLQVHQAVALLRAAHRRLAPANRGVELAERSLAVVRDRYQNGLALLTDLLDAEAALAGARLRQLAAERDLHLAHTALDLAVGRL